jgi:hypothetical protein
MKLTATALCIVEAQLHRNRYKNTVLCFGEHAYRRTEKLQVMSWSLAELDIDT